jgi:hypothetical protein
VWSRSSQVLRVMPRLSLSGLWSWRKLCQRAQSQACSKGRCDWRRWQKKETGPLTNCFGRALSRLYSVKPASAAALTAKGYSARWQTSQPWPAVNARSRNFLILEYVSIMFLFISSFVVYSSHGKQFENGRISSRALRRYRLRSSDDTGLPPLGASPKRAGGFPSPTCGDG